MENKLKKHITSCLNWFITLGWLGFAFYLWFFSGIGKPKELNGIGDFVAGMFAPVAFFWLVRGYYQQGQELKQNTEALRLQADELRNSVEEQRNLIKIHQEELQHKRVAAKPIFQFKDVCFDHRKIEFVTSDEYVPIQQSISFQIENSGTLIHSVNFIRGNFIFKKIPVLKDSIPDFCVLFLSNEEEQQLYRNQELKIDFDIEFTDILGNKNINHYTIELFDMVEGDAGDDYYFACNII